MNFNKLILSLSIIFFGLNLYAQLPNKLERLEGTWTYAKGSGTEEFYIYGDTLFGVASLKDKYGDKVPVEAISIKMVNGNLVYVSKKMEGDSITLQKSIFVSKGKKLKFYNTETQLTEAIKYRVGWFNRNKLIIIIYTADYQKRKLKLYKNNEE